MLWRVRCSTICNRTREVQLNDAQLAEVRRRRAVKNPVKLTLEELDDRLRRRGV